MNTRIVTISIVSLGLSAATAQAQAQSYSLTTLGSPSGGGLSGLVDLDNAGNVLGVATIGAHTEVVEWVGGKTPVVFPRLAADQGANTDYSPVALNKAGGVIGLSVGSGLGIQPRQGIYWDPSHHPTAVAGAEDLSGLSDAGALVGGVGSPDLTQQTAATWASPSAQSAALPYPSIFFCSNPVQNACWSNGGPTSPSGKYVVEYAFQGSGRNEYTSVFVHGVAASNFSGTNVTVSRVTDLGVVVGAKDTGIHSTITADDVSQAYRWEAGTFTSLGALPGAPAGTAFESNAKAINSSGVIVGSSQFQSSNLLSHAVMWVNDKIIDLNTVLAGQLPADSFATDAYALNDSGEFIVVTLNLDTGYNGFFVAKPAIATHTTITSNINPSTYGQQIHLVARISPDSGPVPTTGNVSWYDNGTLLGTARLTKIGTASWEPATWTGGVHNATAVYPGSATLAASTSYVFKQTVNPASTRTGVSAAPSPATHGKSVKLTATVVPTSGTIAGTVTFKSGTTVLGTNTLDARTKQTWLTTSFAKAGSYSITASFAGSQNFIASSSKAVTLIVK
jgi:probable HAF family extracellular repeat protein